MEKKVRVHMKRESMPLERFATVIISSALHLALLRHFFWRYPSRKMLCFFCFYLSADFFVKSHHAHLLIRHKTYKSDYCWCCLYVGSTSRPSSASGLKERSVEGKKKKRDVITNRTDEDYDDYEKVVVPKSVEHKHAILKALQGHFLFGDLAPSSLHDLVDVMKPRTHAPGDVVIQQGDLGEEFFVLVNGVCEVLIEGVGKVHQYDNSGAFGELALMYSSPRAATIRATTESELFILDLRTFRMVLAQANENGLMAKVNFLRKVKLLEGLGDNQITRIAGALTEQKYTDGTYIITQGETGDAFYIINDGKVSLLRFF